MNALWLVVGILATYRVARMMAMEDGPFDVFSWIREKAGQQTWIGRGVHCVLCLSFWLAWLSALCLPHSSLPAYAITSLAISGGVVIVHKVVG